MKVEKKAIKDSILNVTISVSKPEFDLARREAYLNHTDQYPVMGIAPGLAAISDLEKTYGPAVLFDEALSLVIPQNFTRFLKESGIRIMGRPAVEDMQFCPDGSVTFTVKADLYPEVTLGQYKGIAVPYLRSEQQAEFEQAVIQKACEAMQGEIPPHMLKQKLDAIAAQEKLNINNDAVYHLLADMLVILDLAYVAAGVSRPKNQVRREAMDLMLQVASAEHELDWKEFLREQVAVMAERYHGLPADYGAKVDQLIQARQDAKKKMTPEEVTEELFKAYLGSLELTEEQWRNQRSGQAAREVCMDLLLDAVARAEQLEVTQEEEHRFIEELAEKYGMEPEEAEAGIDKDALLYKLKRDKALTLILNSAVTDEEGKKALDQARKEAKEKLNQDVAIRE